LFAEIKQLGARPFYLEAWNGDKFIVERVDDDRSFVVPNLLVGVIGGFQPDKLARAFSGDEDGMYGRFLYGWPVTPVYSPLTDDISEVDPDFQNLLTKLIRLPAEDEHGQFAPLIFPLSPQAREEFEKYRRFVDQVKRGIEGREQQWLAKSETHLLRLAGTLAYLSWADASSDTNGLASISADLEPREIDLQFMIDAVRLMQEYFWPHARAALRQIGLTDRHRHIRRILRWVRANDRHEISLKDIRRDALGGSLDAKQTRDLFDRMVAAGWLQAEISMTGGRPIERWQVNPRVFAPAETAETAGSRLSAVPAVPAVPASSSKQKESIVTRWDGVWKIISPFIKRLGPDGMTSFRPSRISNNVALQVADMAARSAFIRQTVTTGFVGLAEIRRSGNDRKSI
jgi:hypothetical protein